MLDVAHGLCSVKAEGLLPCCRTAFTCAFKSLPSAKPGLCQNPRRHNHASGELGKADVLCTPGEAHLQHL